MAEDVEVGFYVWVAVGVISPETHSGKVKLGGFVQGGGEGVCPGVSSGGVGAPAAGVHPGVAVTGCVDVDGEKEDVVFAEAPADLVDPMAALRKGDVGLFRNQEVGVVAEGCEAGVDALGDEAVVVEFAEEPVGASLAGRFDAVAVVD